MVIITALRRVRAGLLCRVFLKNSGLHPVVIITARIVPGRISVTDLEKFSGFGLDRVSGIFFCPIVVLRDTRYFEILILDFFCKRERKNG